MLFMEFFSILFATLSTQFPVLLIWIAGIYLCLSRRERNPQVSQRCLIAFALFLFVTIGSVAITVLNISLFNSDWSPAQISLLTGGLSLLLNIVRAAGWVLILQAIFNQFPPAEKSPDSF